MSLANEAGVLLAFAVGMFGLFVCTCMFIVPLKHAIKFLINSAVGGITILVINTIGASFGIHISLNIVTAAVVGILGLPGAIMIIFLQAL
jgi:inhibitor of the pro-sigma K processing machinery